MVFPGLAHTVEDWREFAEHFGKALLVPENTYHTGQFIPCDVSWPDWWQKEILVILQDYPSISHIIAHSRGVVDAIKLVPDMRIMDRVTLLAPPIHPRVSKGKKRSAKDFEHIHEVLMDECLSHLCPEFNDAQYEAFLGRHIWWYGNRFREMWKVESPVKSHLQEQCIHELSHLPANWNIEMIVGSDDPWNDNDELEKIQAGRPNMRVQTIESGHFPQVSKAKELATLMKNL